MNREEKYKDYTEEELKEDATMDLLKLLNCFTDLELPNKEQLEYIVGLSKSIKSLRECCHHEEHKHKWEEHYPEVYKHFETLCSSFCNFMYMKYLGKDGSAFIPEIFSSHKALVSIITNMSSVTEKEKEIIYSSIKK
jgi:hypothetical protein